MSTASASSSWAMASASTASSSGIFWAAYLRQAAIAPGVSATQLRSTAMLCQIAGQSPTFSANCSSWPAACRHAPRMAGSRAWV